MPVTALDRWCTRWNLPQAAVQELLEIFTRPMVASQTVSKPQIQRTEAGVMSRVRLEASQKGVWLWRNNVGATYTKDGAFLRYGLANDSQSVNTVIKSADLIGIRPILITETDIGRTIGQFVSREIKAADWKYQNTEREEAQLAWAQAITARGGDACFATKEGTL